MAPTETAPSEQTRMTWKPYVITLVVCVVAVWAAFFSLADFNAAGWTACIAIIPATWAIYRLVFGAARRWIPARLKTYLGTLLTCALVTALTIAPHAGFMLVFVVIALAIWVMLSIIPVVRKPEQLKTRAIILGLWVATILIVLGVHWHYAVDARRAGDECARAIERYKVEHGVYPPDEQAAGLAPRRNSYMLSYMLYEGRPSLIYAATFTIFETYDYDFEHHIWVFQPD